MPLSDRDYMRNSPPRWESGGYRVSRGLSFGISPVLIIIAVNLLIFLIIVIFSQLVYGLGLSPTTFLGRPWTLVTSMFVHAGFGHIFGNMLTLFFFGTYLTRLVGNNKFLFVYLVGGILGNILYLLLAPPLSIAVGASGAVYAVAGVLAMMKPKLKVFLYFFIPMPLWVVVLVFFVIWSFFPGVAWQAHLGGLALGLTAGYFFRKRERSFF